MLHSDRSVASPARCGLLVSGHRRGRWRATSTLSSAPRGCRPARPRRRDHRAARRADVLRSGRRYAYKAAAAAGPTTPRCSSARRTSSRSTAWRSIRAGAFDSPLGPRADRRGARRRLIARVAASSARCPAAHAREHSLEMQLPFLRRAAAGRADRPAADGLPDGARRSRQLADALARRRADDALLLVASTRSVALLRRAHRERARHARAGLRGGVRSRPPAAALRAVSGRRARPLRRVRRRPDDRGHARGAGARRAARARAEIRAFGRGLRRQQRRSSATWPARSGTFSDVH